MDDQVRLADRAGAPRAAGTAAGEVEAIQLAQRIFDTTPARALVLIDGGKIVWERTREPASAASVFHGYSVTKSLMSVATGQAICAGALSLKDTVAQNVPALARTDLGKASVRDLLMMASGVQSTSPDGGLQGLVDAVDFGVGSIPDALAEERVSKAKAGLLSTYKPGDAFDYKNTDPEALGFLVHGKTGKTLASWLSEKVLVPAGANGPVYIGGDRAGNTNASYGLRMTIDDWAKVAVWVRQQARNKDCLGDYLRAAMSRQIYNISKRTLPAAAGYGYLFWTDFADAPGSSWASGYGGQVIAWHRDNDRILLAFSTVENWSPSARQLFKVWAQAKRD